MSKIVLFSSQKREVGKTVLAAKVAAELSKKNKKVMLIDLSEGKRKLSEYFRVEEDIIYDVKDVLSGVCSAEQAALAINDNLYLLPYPRMSGKFKDTDADSFRALRESIDESYDAIMVDMDSLLSGYFVKSQGADCVVLVNNGDYSTVTQVFNEREVAAYYGIKKVMIAINRFNKKNGSKGTELRQADIKKLIGDDVAGIIEEDSSYANPDYDFIFTGGPDSMNSLVARIAAGL